MESQIINRRKVINDYAYSVEWIKEQFENIQKDERVYLVNKMNLERRASRKEELIRRFFTSQTEVY